MNRVDVDPISGVLQRGGLRHIGDGALGGAVGGDVRLPHKPVNRGEVDDPAAVAGGVVRLLGEHLGGGVFDAEPDAAGVDGDGLVEDLDGGFVDAPGLVAGCGFCGDAWEWSASNGRRFLKEGR